MLKILRSMSVCLLLLGCSSGVDSERLNDEVANIEECQKSISFKNIPDDDWRNQAFNIVQSFIENEPSVDVVGTQKDNETIDVQGTHQECIMFIKYIGVSEDYPFNRIEILDR